MALQYNFTERRDIDPICWPRNTCTLCLDKSVACVWCPFSNTCVPPVSDLVPPLLTPIFDSGVCPMPSERFEMRSRPLGCAVSPATAYATVFTFLITLFICFLVSFLFFRCLARYYIETNVNDNVGVTEWASANERVGQWNPVSQNESVLGDGRSTNGGTIFTARAVDEESPLLGVAQGDGTVVMKSVGWWLVGWRDKAARVWASETGSSSSGCQTQTSTESTGG